MTKVIVDERGSGKTTAIVRAALADPDAVIVCRSAAERDRLVREHKVPRHQALCALDTKFLQGQHHKPRFYVDDADLVLSALFGLGSIEACTFTGFTTTVDGGKQ